MDDLLREFVGESLDMMEAVASDLVAWEANPETRAGIDKIFRTIHTVKGSSSFFALPRVTALAHATEELLDALRARHRVPDRATVATVLSAFDQIKALVIDVAAQGAEPEGDDGVLIAQLTRNVRSSDVPEQVRALAENGVEAEVSAAPPLSDIDAHDRAVPLEWRSVRVPLGLLDALMSGVSDLVLARNEVSVALRKQGIDPDAMAAFERLSGTLGSVRASVSQMRMVPMRQMFAPLPRIVRQVSVELGKDVQLVTEGGEVEIDREVIEALRDPIVHVLRNAIDHGIERAEDRGAAGKPALATIRIAGRQSGNRIVISIADDGAGIAESALVERAIAAGQLTPERAPALDSTAIANLIFLPGLSTAQAVTDISGRGVGMDVVKANVERLGGNIAIRSVAGRGVTISIDVPMTLTIISALAITVDDQEFAIARSAVAEVLLCSSDAIQRVSVGGTPMVRVRGRLMPLVVIEDLLGLGQVKNGGGEDRALVLCRGAGMVMMAIEVPDVRDHAELVIKPLPPIMQASGLYNGFSLPDTGQPMLVLDVEGIARLRNLQDAGGSAVGDESGGRGAVADATKRQWLCFEPLSSPNLAALPMECIDRVLDVAVRDIHHSGGTHGGRMVASVSEMLLPVIDTGTILAGDDDASVRMICITDGSRMKLMPVRSIAHLAALDAATVGGGAGDAAGGAADDAAGDAVLGLVMFGDRLVELMDVYALFDSAAQSAAAAQASSAGSATRDVVIVADARRGWSERILAPTLSAAGYSVKLVDDVQAAAGAATLILTDDDADSGGDDRDVLVVRRGDNSHRVATYDRAGLLRALQSSAHAEQAQAMTATRRRKGDGR